MSPRVAALCGDTKKHVLPRSCGPNVVVLSVPAKRLLRHAMPCHARLP